MPSYSSDPTQWRCPLEDDAHPLGEVYDRLRKIGLTQDEIPWLVQLTENPQVTIPGFDCFTGGTDLATHDYIHILLGRGLLPKDEAFVLGFTMGSTNRLGATEERLYTLCSRYLFPKSYRFGDDDIHVFKDAVRLGFVSDCMPLDTVVYEDFRGMTVAQARAALGIEKPLLRAYFQIERARYPDCVESQRLLDQAPSRAT